MGAFRAFFGELEGKLAMERGAGLRATWMIWGEVISGKKKPSYHKLRLRVEARSEL